ncbi:unnamed protein product, partial [Thlaspi arvense]
MESLPHHVVERILERLPVKPLMRFKAVSKQWRSTIESPFFQGRQLKHRQQSGDPDTSSSHPGQVESLATLALVSSSLVEIPTPWDKKQYLVCQSSCDGLVCVYNAHIKSGSGFVFNPTTRWHRVLPLCELQRLIVDKGYGYYRLRHGCTNLGFGKDKFTGTYKPVWLYNSAEIGRENATTCEVFDFSTNSWRYVTPSSPYRILSGYHHPVYVDGSVHWFTECKETKVVSFDLHTEAFQAVSAPFANAPVNEMAMCNLHNRLCVSLKKCSNQVIWSFNSGNKTWDQLCSIDLDAVSLRFAIPTLVCAVQPLALLDGEKKKKKKLLFYDIVSHRTLMTYDLDTKSYDTAAKFLGDALCYFPSLFSVL